MGQRSRFQAVALLARAERARIRADSSITEAQRDTLLKRLDGVATILAHTAAREPSLFSLLQEDAEVTDATRRLQREMQLAAGLDPTPDTDAASPDRRRPRAHRAQGPPAVCGRGPAGQSVPGPRLHPGEAQGRRVAWSAGS